MEPINFFKRFGVIPLSPEEEEALARELSAAYHVDEAAASSRDVQRIAEKIRARLADPPDVDRKTFQGPHA